MLFVATRTSLYSCCIILKMSKTVNPARPQHEIESKDLLGMFAGPGAGERASASCEPGDAVEICCSKIVTRETLRLFADETWDETAVKFRPHLVDQSPAGHLVDRAVQMHGQEAHLPREAQSPVARRYPSYGRISRATLQRGPTVGTDAESLHTA